jgi:hypothetical protein
LAANDTRCISCGAVTQVQRAVNAGVLITPEQYRKKKRRQAIAAVLLGLVLLGAGAAVYPNQNKEGTAAGPKSVTAADLAKLQNPGDLPNPWVEYIPDRVFDTGIKIVRNKLGRKQETKTRFLLAPVGDRWLLTEVSADFTGLRLEGQLRGGDTPMYKNLTEKVRRQFPDKAARLLPYQLDCETSFAKDTRTHTMVGMGLALFGLLAVVLGVAGFFVRPRTV